MDSVRVGAFIAALRREQGFTQKQLAEKIGVTDKAISRWETGKGYPDVTLLLQLGETLGVTLNEVQKVTSRNACDLFGLQVDIDKQ